MWRRKVTDRLLRAREVADLFGVSSGTILDWFEADKLPAPNELAFENVALVLDAYRRLRPPS